MLQVIEDGLVAQLTRAFTREGDARPWLKVEAWPLRPEGYTLTGAGEVSVIYLGAKYHIEDTSSTFYNATLEYEIALRARSLRDNQGAYDMVETARRATCGRRLEDAAGITVPVRDGFSGYGEAVFSYSLVVSVPVVVVPEAHDEPPGPWVEDSDEAAQLKAIHLHMQLTGGR